MADGRQLHEKILRGAYRPREKKPEPELVVDAIVKPKHRCRMSVGECQRELRWLQRPCSGSCAMADYLAGIQWRQK